MQTFMSKGSEYPKEFEKTSTVYIIRESIQPYSETDENGDTVTGFVWFETRLSPEEVHLIELGKGLYDQASPSTAVKKVYLRSRLADTDYTIAKIAEAEGAEAQALREEYADIITQRRQWRAELNQL